MLIYALFSAFDLLFQAFLGSRMVMTAIKGKAADTKSTSKSSFIPSPSPLRPHAMMMWGFLSILRLCCEHPRLTKCLTVPRTLQVPHGTSGSLPNCIPVDPQPGAIFHPEMPKRSRPGPFRRRPILTRANHGDGEQACRNRHHTHLWTERIGRIQATFSALSVTRCCPVITLHLPVRNGLELD